MRFFFLHPARAAPSVESQGWRASGRGSESSRGTAGNESLPTARRSRREGERELERREERERESRGVVEVWESRTKASGQGSRDRAPLAPSEGLTETHFGAGVRADQSLKGAGTYWKVKGLEKNMKESTIVMAFLPVVTAHKKHQQNK